MKSTQLRELFETARTKSNRFGLRVRLTFLVTLELIVCIAASFGIYYLVNALIDSVEIPVWLVVLIVSTTIGAVATSFISRLFFNPIKKLGKAMEQVADGDFSVRITTESSSQEIQEIYSGFNLMTHELSATEILQSDFVSNVSHEFKTPINAIEGYSMLLQNGDNLTEEQQLYVDKIFFNTKRLSSLVGSILLLSKLENQSITTKNTSFRLDEQIRQAILALEESWDNKEIEFDVELEEIDYIGQESLLHHVWSNLISNAIKFSPRGDTITLTLKNRDNMVIFSVVDNGSGLSEEAKKHVFDKFYQDNTVHKTNGNGLGLALVKKIVTLSGGSVFADNSKQGGAIFTVILPYQKNTEQI